MDRGKENSSVLFQPREFLELESRISGTPGVKSFLKTASQAGDGTKRKPLGTVNFQSIGESSKKDAKRKQINKPLDVNVNKAMDSEKRKLMLKLQNLTIHKQPSGVLTCAVPSGPLLPSAEPEYDDIEYMDLSSRIEDDTCNLFPISEQPSTYVSDLLNWYPCVGNEWKNSSSCSVSPACSLSSLSSPTWQDRDLWSEETTPTVPLPDLPTSEDFASWLNSLSLTNDKML